MRKQGSKQPPPATGRSRRPGARSRTVTLPARFGIEEARELHARLAPHVAAPEPIELQAAEPGRVHTAALQVLAAFFRTRAEAGRATAWRKPPAILRDSAAQLGMDGVLGLAATLI